MVCGHLLIHPKGLNPQNVNGSSKKKKEADEKVETYKIHLIAKRYHQRYSIDYDEIFSLMAMLNYVQIMLAIATHLDYEIS